MYIILEDLKLTLIYGARRFSAYNEVDFVSARAGNLPRFDREASYFRHVQPYAPILDRNDESKSFFIFNSRK